MIGKYQGIMQKQMKARTRHIYVKTLEVQPTHCPPRCSSGLPCYPGSPDPRNAHLAHEEASHPRYTHILSMGCSRKHCRECDALRKLFLGEGYTAHTSAVSQSGSSEQIPLIETITKETGVDLTVTIPVQKYQVALQEATVRSEREKHSTNYRLSDRLQALIRAKSALALDFSAPRFPCLLRSYLAPRGTSGSTRRRRRHQR